LNQASVESSYSTTHSSRQALPNSRSATGNTSSQFCTLTKLHPPQEPRYAISCVGNLTKTNVPWTIVWWVRGSVVVKALCDKSECRRFGTRWGEWILFNLPNPSGRSRPWGLLSLWQKWVPETEKLCFWGVERCRCVGLTTLVPSVSRIV
jgi:hypothetical protein